jgi:segregation and condensation protein A
MAAMLIEIKSRMLLPPKKTAEGQEAEDPRAELVRRLIEYEQMKLAAARLNALPQFGRDFLKAEITIEQSCTALSGCESGDLQEAWRDILKRARAGAAPQDHPRRTVGARAHGHGAQKAAGAAFCRHLKSLFDPERRTPVLVVTFIAMLELAKETLIEITQAEAFAPIYVRLAYSHNLQ